MLCLLYLRPLRSSLCADFQWTLRLYNRFSTVGVSFDVPQACCTGIYRAEDQAVLVLELEMNSCGRTVWYSLASAPLPTSYELHAPNPHSDPPTSRHTFSLSVSGISWTPSSRRSLVVTNSQTNWAVWNVCLPILCRLRIQRQIGVRCVVLWQVV